MAALALPDRCDVAFAKHVELPLGPSGLGTEQRLNENVGRQDELEVAFPNDVTDVKVSVSVLNSGHVTGIENGVQVPSSHSTPRRNATTERREGALANVNGGLQSKVCTHVGWQATSMGFIPLFTLER